MLMMNWFRRMPTKEIKCAMEPAVGVSPARRWQEWGGHHAMLVEPVCSVRFLSSAHNQRNSCLFALPATMSEDMRSKLKYLRTRRDVPPTRAKAGAAGARPTPDTQSEDESASLVSEEGEEGVARDRLGRPDAISTSMTRNATARVVLRKPLEYAEDVRPTPERIQCPKPNALSPYSRHSDDPNEEATTLKNHYTKVLLQPHKPFEVTFPIVPNQHRATNAPMPTKKGRSMDPYLAGTSSPRSRLMTANVHPKIIGNSTQNRHIQSDTKSESLHNSINNYRFIRKTPDTRRLDLANCTTQKLAPVATNPQTLRKKHVEVVRMEVVKLDRKVRSDKQLKGINQELQTVLQEALAQAKAYEQNVVDAQKHDDNETDTNCPQNLLSLKRSYPNTSRSCHSSVALNKEDARPGSRQSFNTAKNHMRAQSEDGKNCYSVLKEPENAADIHKRPHSKPEEVDVSMALTDLNAYEDIKACQPSAHKMLGKPYKRMKRAKMLPTDSYVSKLERDYNLAQKQHNQRVLDVLDIVNDMKVK